MTGENYPQIQQTPAYVPGYSCFHRKNSVQKYTLIWLIIIVSSIIIFILASCYNMQPARAEVIIPTNLWQGLIAEDTSGNYQTYLAIASVVHNRLNNGLNNGLVALKRQKLEHFVKQNCDYMLKTKGLDLTVLATKAITEVWLGKDFANGATHYEHTGIYPIPSWAKKMQVVKVLYKGTKEELTLWKN